VGTTFLRTKAIPLRVTIIRSPRMRKLPSEQRRDHSPQLSIFTDGSLADSGAVGYVVSWKRELQWKDHNAYDIECVAIA